MRPITRSVMPTRGPPDRLNASSPRRRFRQVAIELRDQRGLVTAGILALEEPIAGLVVQPLPTGLFVTGIDRIEQRPGPAGRLEVARRVADHQHLVLAVAVPHGSF